MHCNDLRNLRIKFNGVVVIRHCLTRIWLCGSACQLRVQNTALTFNHHHPTIEPHTHNQQWPCNLSETDIINSNRRIIAKGALSCSRQHWTSLHRPHTVTEIAHTL